MQDALSRPSLPAILPFESFLRQLFDAFDQAGVRPCVLRNYQGFPAANHGTDIDFFLDPAQLPQAVRAVQSIPGLRLVGYAERPHVASLYVEGTSGRVPAGRFIQLDFDLGVTWKGLSFLSNAAIEAGLQLQSPGNCSFWTPAPVHEAVISLLFSLLVGGWVKEKYLPAVQATFARDEAATLAALEPAFGAACSRKLLAAVVASDRAGMLACVKPMRRTLLTRSLTQRPRASLRDLAAHYLAEIKLRFSPQTLQTIRLLQVNDGRRAQPVADLLPLFVAASGNVAHQPDFGSEDSRGKPTPAAMLVWLARQWRRQCLGRRSLALCFCDGPCTEAVAQAHSAGSWTQRVFLRWIAALMPPTALWVAAQDQTETVYESVVRELARRTAHQLARRFGR